MGSGSFVVGFDGSFAAERALREGGALLAPRRALVVVVWEAGLALQALEIPTATVGLPPVPIDLRAGLELEDALHQAAQRIAQRGVQVAGEVGLEADGLAVADEVTVAETLVRVAQERDAEALVMGTRGHSGLSKVLLGSTAEGVIRKAPCPVVVARLAGESSA